MRVRLVIRRSRVRPRRVRQDSFMTIAFPLPSHGVLITGEQGKAVQAQKWNWGTSVGEQGTEKYFLFEEQGRMPISSRIRGNT